MSRVDTAPAELEEDRDGDTSSAVVAEYEVQVNAFKEKNGKLHTYSIF